ncbi:hypothetical protein M2R47_04705 [Moraxella sp. Tifton1]|uniref:hypothetical protein n=1 Tax=Moraxella oculi TaxID=2940516 RepID=UPI002013059A|nr:hypothetical protein [Moraxella sp. Tifton1]MCL1623545.1 hypothetical protein [Moraxella sp. Tifton1]
MAKFVLISIVLALLAACSKYDRNDMLQKATSDDEMRELFVERNIKACQQGFLLKEDGWVQNSKESCNCLLNYASYYIGGDDIRLMIAPTTPIGDYEKERLGGLLYDSLKFGASQCLGGLD